MLLNVEARLADDTLSIKEIDSVFTSNVGWNYSVFSFQFLDTNYIICDEHCMDVLSFKLVKVLDLFMLIDRLIASEIDNFLWCRLLRFLCVH